MTRQLLNIIQGQQVEGHIVRTRMCTRPGPMPCGSLKDTADAYDARGQGHGAVAVILPKAGRTTPISYDAGMYKWRYLVQNFFCKIMESRPIATRYNKTDTSYAVAINIVATVLTIR